MLGNERDPIIGNQPGSDRAGQPLFDHDRAFSRPHPFTAAGNQEFNSLIWMPPMGKRGGDILLADSTIFTTLFGGTESLEQFWRNMAQLQVRR